MKKSIVLWIATLLVTLQSTHIHAEEGNAIYDERAEKASVMGTEGHDFILVKSAPGETGALILSFDSALFDEVPDFITNPDILEGPGVEQVAVEMGHFDTVDVKCYAGHDIVIMEGPFKGRVYGGDGDDQVRADNKGTTFYGHAGEDEFTGSDFADVVIGGPDDDTINCGGGNDVVKGGGGDDTIRGGSGDDTIYGEGDNDEIRGGSGNDRLFGDEGDDEVYGDEGKDTLVDGSGSDTLEGGFDGSVDTLILQADDDADRAVRQYVGESRFIRVFDGAETNIGLFQIDGDFSTSVKFRFYREVFEEDRVFGGDDLDDVADETVENLTP